MCLTDEIKSFIYKEGASIVGFADLRCLPKEVRQNFDSGIVIGLSYSKEAMMKNKNGYLVPL